MQSGYKAIPCADDVKVYPSQFNDDNFFSLFNSFMVDLGKSYGYARLSCRLTWGGTGHHGTFGCHSDSLVNLRLGVEAMPFPDIPQDKNGKTDFVKYADKIQVLADHGLAWVDKVSSKVVFTGTHNVYQYLDKNIDYTALYSGLIRNLDKKTMVFMSAPVDYGTYRPEAGDSYWCGISRFVEYIEKNKLGVLVRSPVANNRNYTQPENLSLVAGYTWYPPSSVEYIVPNSHRIYNESAILTHEKLLARYKKMWGSSKDEYRTPSARIPVGGDFK